MLGATARYNQPSRVGMWMMSLTQAAVVLVTSSCLASRFSATGRACCCPWSLVGHGLCLACCPNLNPDPRCPPILAQSGLQGGLARDRRTSVLTPLIGAPPTAAPN